jgi:RNA-binding protein YhbY
MAAACSCLVQVRGNQAVLVYKKKNQLQEHNIPEDMAYTLFSNV